MRTTFYIHIGVHKTGTKSIQQTLSGNRKTLLKHGINSFPGDPNHGPDLISLITAKPHKDMRNIRRHLDTPEKAISYNASTKHEIMKALNRNRSPKMVISGEGLSGRSEGEIGRLKEMLAPYAGAYRIIVYVRDHYEYANSASQQRLKSGAILEVYDRMLPVPNYQRRLSPYIRVFGRENVDIRIFDPKRFVEGDLIADFLVAIGESPQLAKSLNVVRANQSMSHEAAMILSETNKVIPAFESGLANRARAATFHTSIVTIEGEKFSINPAEYLKYENEIRNDVGWLDRTIGEPAFGRSAPKPLSAPRWGDATIRSIKELVGSLGRQLRSLEKYRGAARNPRPAIPSGLEWLREAYGETAQERQPAAAPHFDQACVQALGCFIHALTLDLQHLKAERDLRRGRFLIWIDRRWAENHFREVVRRNPNLALGQYRLSQAHLLCGHLGEARKTAERAIQIEPDRALFQHWLKLVNASGRWFFKPKTEYENSLPSRPRVRISEEERIKRQKARAARGTPGIKAGRTKLGG